MISNDLERHLLLSPHRRHPLNQSFIGGAVSKAVTGKGLIDFGIEFSKDTGETFDHLIHEGVDTEVLYDKLQTPSCQDNRIHLVASSGGVILSARRGARKRLSSPSKSTDHPGACREVDVKYSFNKPVKGNQHQENRPQFENVAAIEALLANRVQNRKEQGRRS